MRIIKDETLIKRNGRIGQIMTLGALGVLGIGMYLTFKRPDLFAYSIGALIMGFTMTQVGMYFSNRFGRSPRPDEKLDSGLKGLPGDTTIYHYVTSVPHLLVGPMGIWVLLPYHQRGVVAYERNRWRLRRGGFMQAYMAVFGQEGLGRPDADAAAQVASVQRQFAKSLGEQAVPPINAALVFTNDEAEIDTDGAPLPTLHVRKLKDFLRQLPRDARLAAEQLRGVQQFLPQS
ncbi:MAG TPA: hypothetical protein VIU38_10210 [Anaerolineales bacterium]